MGDNLSLKDFLVIFTIMWHAKTTPGRTVQQMLAILDVNYKAITYFAVTWKLDILYGACM